ncbi:MAG TPA: nitrite/sulfite reductase [Magnetospirillaceae bacterium]
MNAIAPTDAEPLVRLSDLDEYKAGLTRRLSNEWDEEKWTGYRTRFGVYGQKQPGVQMIRIKVPGGVLQVDQLSALAEFGRRFCQGDLHVTTRQDVQAYFVPLEQSAEALSFLYEHGLTTREACGNTFRNITACALSGICPREHVDAAAVAERLARAWIRNPLVQHMPRKSKISISGCGTDCAASAIHDLAFIATNKDGKNGFIVYAGGGLGGQPRPAVKVLDFVTEDELPTVQEATARLHQRYSDRVNRNNARLKFLVKRFGEAKFVELFVEEFNRLRDLPQRPWKALDWREPGEGKVAKTPVGVVDQHDGKIAVIGNPSLGLLSPTQLDQLFEIANAFGVPHVRTTRDQNIVLPGIDPKDRDAVVARLEAIGIPVPTSPETDANVVTCPGTTSCRIGITNSQNFARAIADDVKVDPTARGLAVRISGCQNGCGQHHIGDFGFHGMAKKVNGQPAPHYQIHVGGEVQTGRVGVNGPIVPARHAVAALRLLRKGYAEQKQESESVRGWAERVGRPGMTSLLTSLDGVEDDKLFIDYGEQEIFKGAPTERGECAAPFASDDLLADLANDALIRSDRYLAIGKPDGFLADAETASVFAARRALHHALRFTKDDDSVESIFTRLRELDAKGLNGPLANLIDARAKAETGAAQDVYRETVAYFLDAANAYIAGVSAEQEAAE